MNNPFLTGYERDTASGLDYANARMYDHGRGRFMQPDPIGLKGAKKELPLSLNRYSYVLNDPVNQVDPSGLLTLIIGGAGNGTATPWGLPGDESGFFEAVWATFGERPEIWEWSGEGYTIIDNFYEGIFDAANKLAKYINGYEFKPGEKLNIVAHSHGGNVAKLATNKDLKRPIDNLVTLGTPVNYDLLLFFNPSNVKNYCNVSSFTDPVQFAGASPLQIAAFGYYAYQAGRFARLAAWAFFNGFNYLGALYSFFSALAGLYAIAWWLSTKLDPFANTNVLFDTVSHSNLHTAYIWNRIERRPCGLR